MIFPKEPAKPFYSNIPQMSPFSLTLWAYREDLYREDLQDSEGTFLDKQMVFFVQFLQKLQLHMLDILLLNQKHIG